MDRVLVCLDRGEHAAAVLGTATNLARRVDARLLLFRAVGLQPSVPEELREETPDRVCALLLDEAKAELAELGAAIAPELVESVHAATGVPWQAICAAGHAHAVDLIVIGWHDYGGLDRVLGTTAGKVVNHADRPVLVVRPTGSLAASAPALH